MKVIKNVRLYDFETYCENGFVAFDEQIRGTGRMSEYPSFQETTELKEIEAIEEIDGKGAFLMPGLVLGHSHMYSAFARGWLTPFDPRSFQDILEQMWWKLDGALGEEEIYYSAWVSGHSFLKNGITTVIDHHASGEKIKESLMFLKKAIVDERGLRGIFCFETSDRFDVEACIEENITFYEQAKKEQLEGKSHKVAGLLGLHASFSLSDESLIRCQSAPKDMPLHIHVAESMEDVVWTKTNTGMNIMKRLEKHGLLREDTLYVHGVHLAKEELEMIKQTKGVMVFNPSSNMNNGVGLPPVMEVVQKGMRWMVGNDGLGFSLARDLQNMVFTSNLKGANTFPLEALRQSILTSYDYASKRLGCKLGRFKKGFEADFLLLDYKQMTSLTKENAFGHFVYGMLDGFVPKEVWVEGQQKVRAYEVVQNDEKKLSEAQKVANRVWEKLKK